MPILDLYHKRKQRAERAGDPDVYRYDVIPSVLSFQVTMILSRAIGPYSEYNSRRGREIVKNDVWNFIRDALAEEVGRNFLTYPNSNPDVDVIDFLREQGNIDLWLSTIELGFRIVDNFMRKMEFGERKRVGTTCSPDDAIKELNDRFREHGVGYQYENYQIVRIDSELIHAEIVKPALLFLSDSRFDGPEEEYLAAHTHYRVGEYEDAIVDTNRAFESVMRTICDLMGSPAPSSATASSLVGCVRKLGLLPDYLGGSFDQLVSVLKAGLPSVRNNAGGHGQGSSPRQTPAYVAGYTLHICASNILFLVEAFKDAEKREAN